MTEPTDRNANGGPAAVAAAAEAVLSVENAPLPLVVCHPDGRVAMANRAMRALLGYRDGEIVNRRVWELQADPESGRHCFDKLLHDGEMAQHFVLLCGRDGEMVPTYGSAVVTRDDDGKISLVIAQALPA